MLEYSPWHVVGTVTAFGVGYTAASPQLASQNCVVACLKNNNSSANRDGPLRFDCITCYVFGLMFNASNDYGYTDLMEAAFYDIIRLS